MKFINEIFKMGILIIAGAFLIVFFMASQNDRYQYVKDEGFTVFDTRQGVLIAAPEGLKEKYYHIDFPNSKVTVKKARVLDK